MAGMDYEQEKLEKERKEANRCCANCGWAIEGIVLYYCEHPSAKVDNESDCHKRDFSCSGWTPK